ncbi:MAG: hypothetical protein GXP49_07395 [Deltaproteobacteria bacterium]|nr:hypothetical protein [Deltaproteobacteria bacterium]
MPGANRYRSHNLVLLSFFSLTCLFQTSCGDTGEQRTSFKMAVSAPDDMGTDFENDLGWKVVLDSASVVIGPIYFFSGEPLFSMSRLLDWLDPIPTAFAHPGHYVAGEALGQVLDQARIDLLSEMPQVLGTATGVTGLYNSARVYLKPAGDDTYSVLVTGTATKDQDHVSFKGELDVEIKLEGLPCGIHVEPGKAGGMVMFVDPRIWLKRVDFSTLAGPDQDGYMFFEKGTSNHSAFSRGVDNAGAFSFSWK